MTQYRSKSKGHKQKDSGLDLSLGQVLAATGATTLGAVLVKLLNIWGTILGTAVLSICTSIGAVLILRAVNRTGDKIKAQLTALAPVVRPGARQSSTIELGAGHATATARIPTAEELADLDAKTAALDRRAAPDEETGEIAADPTVVLESDGEPAGEPPADEAPVDKRDARKRTLVAIAVSSILVFGLTVGVLYVLGTLTGDPQRFVQQQPEEVITTIIESPGDETATEDTDATTDETTQPSDEATSDSPSADESTTPDESTTSDTSSEAPAEEEASGDTGSGGSEETATDDAEELEQELSPSESAS